MKTWVRPLAILALGTVFLLCSLFFYTSNRAPDDAFIALRYAGNLAGGEGLHFNPGGERVEGFSSPLHVLSMSAAIALGAPPLYVSQMSSILAGLACVVLVAWWGQKRLGMWWGSLAALSVALNPSLGFWSRGGLETTLFAALVTGTLIAAAEEKWNLAGLLAGLLTVTRPEGPLYGAVLVLYVLVWQRRNLKTFLVPGLLMIGAWLPWFVFRVLYFHDVFPNTYYAKMDGVRAALVDRGLDYAAGFLTRSEILVPVLLVGIGLLTNLRPAGSRRLATPAWPWAAVGFVGASLVFAVVSGGDHMNHARFLIPTVPAVMLLAAWSAGRIVSLVPRRGGRLLAGGALGLVLLSQPVRIVSHDLRHPVYPLDRQVGPVEPLNDYSIPLFLRMGYRLKEVLPADAVIAVAPAGALPFASGLTVIDMHGLNDRQMAKRKGVALGHDRPGHEKGSGEMVLARKPDYILLRHSLNEDPSVASPPVAADLKSKPIREIWEDASFHREYEAVIIDLGPTGSFSLYRRRSQES